MENLLTSISILDMQPVILLTLGRMRYIELNPVVANMVSKPEEYNWSSYMVNAQGKESALVHHEEYFDSIKIKKRNASLIASYLNISYQNMISISSKKQMSIVNQLVTIDFERLLRKNTI